MVKANYTFFEVDYYGIDNDDYVAGAGFCCEPQAQTKNARSIPTENVDYEKLQYYYHSDHLGSASYITNLDGEVVQHIEYVPFGEVFLEERNNTWNTPYLFNGKELDEETGLYYYGARYYNPRTSLWLSVDPIATYNPVIETEHYIDGQHNGGVFNSFNLNVYGYCYQNPVKLLDPNGKQALIPFSSPDDAATNFAELFNDNSIRINREMGAYIYSVLNSTGGTDYGYTVPVTGDPAGLSSANMATTRNSLPSGATVVAYTHTHAASTAHAPVGHRYQDNVFSGTPGTPADGGDIGFAHANGINGYVVTPNGSHQKYDINTMLASILSTSMPSDTGPGTGVSGTAAASTSSYQIQSGDTLTSIARRYGTTVSAIASENSITNINEIRAGDTLNVTN